MHAIRKANSTSSCVNATFWYLSKCGCAPVSAFGGAAASVDRFKQKRLQRAAQHWLLQHHGERWPPCRFDVVTVQGDGTIEWIRDAFAA